MKQSRRIEIAKDTLEILEKGFYTNKKGKRIDINRGNNEDYIEILKENR